MKPVRGRKFLRLSNTEHRRKICIELPMREKARSATLDPTNGDSRRWIFLQNSLTEAAAIRVWVSALVRSSQRALVMNCAVDPR
jgi:hypothetical protein